MNHSAVYVDILYIYILEVYVFRYVTDTIVKHSSWHSDENGGLRNPVRSVPVTYFGPKSATTLNGNVRSVYTLIGRPSGPCTCVRPELC